MEISIDAWWGVCECDMAMKSETKYRKKAPILVRNRILR